MKNIGITGQSGFIGTHLFNILSLSPDKYKLILFEDNYFQNNSQLLNFVKECNVIIHLAAVNRHHDQNTLYSVNIELVNKLIDAMQSVKSKAHIIFSSSIQENTKNIYGRSKKDGRQKLVTWSKKNGNSFTGLVIPNVFGPFGQPFYNSVISTFSYQLTNGELPNIEIDAELRLIYISELIQNIIDIIETQEEQIIEKKLIAYTSTAKVSDILNKLKIFKQLYFNNGTIPHLNSSFDINLFNTFRSYIRSIEFFPYKYKIHKDNRGVFVEIMRLKSGGQVSFSTTKPGITRGNHFHTRKIERFSVVQGEALIQLRKIGTSEVY